MRARWKLPGFLVALLLLILVRTSHGQLCASGSTSGPNSLLKKRDSVDNNVASSYVHTDAQYMFTCCGVVTQWAFYAKNSGNIRLQIWRPAGSSMKLVGENIYSVSSSGVKKLPVPIADRITIQYGDYIGWKADAKIITYSSGSASDSYRLSITYDSAFYTGGSLADWSSATALKNRLYAVQATTIEDSSPSFSSLSTPVELYQSDLTSGDPVFLVSVYDIDPLDLDLVVFSRLDTLSSYFQHSETNNATDMDVTFSLVNIPPVGNYTVEFQVRDPCFNTASGTKLITVKYKALSITSLPVTVMVYQTTFGITPLHTIIVGAEVAFACVIILVTPSAGNFIIDTGVIKSLDPSSLTAPSVYSIDVSCEDSEGTSDVQTLTVNVLENTAPRITGFTDAVVIDARTTNINDVVYSISIIDDEGDHITIASFCEQNPCPFEILTDGNTICTADISTETVTTFVLHLAATDGSLWTAEHILSIYLQNTNSPPMITNLVEGITNLLVVGELTSVSSVLANLKATDLNGDDVVFQSTFDPPVGTSYIALSSLDGTMTLIQTLDYVVLASANMTVFGVNVSVSDGLANSPIYTLQIMILPGTAIVSTFSNTMTPTTLALQNAVMSTTETPAFNMDLVTMILLGVVGALVLLVVALVVMVFRKMSNSQAEDVVSSRAELLSTHSKFRVFQVQPKYEKESLVHITKPKMGAIHK